MSGVLKMPRMGETMDEGKLLAWLVEPGQPFKRGDAILEVETDKTIVEYPALGDGTLVESLVEIGEMVEVGTPIAKIDVGDGPDWISDGSEEGSKDDSDIDTGVGRDLDSRSDSDITKKVDGDVSTNVASKDRAAAEIENSNTETRRLRAVDTVSADAPASSSHIERQRATPLARRIAKKAKLDLATIVGTGRRGRIERSDVEAAAQVSACLLYTSPSPRDRQKSRMPSSA